MSKRFFKATDGKVTVFRSSETRAYRSASFVTRDTGKVARISFSAGSGSYATEEISEAEYRALVARKIERAPGSSSPQDSWISNAAL